MEGTEKPDKNYPVGMSLAEAEMFAIGGVSHHIPRHKEGEVCSVCQKTVLSKYNTTRVCELCKKRARDKVLESAQPTSNVDIVSKYMKNKKVVAMAIFPKRKPLKPKLDK
jgi:predicted amidophosphoribosyltransferase